MAQHASPAIPAEITAGLSRVELAKPTPSSGGNPEVMTFQSGFTGMAIEHCLTTGLKDVLL